MRLEEIKSKVTQMSQEEQDHLAAYLVHLRHQRERGANEQTARRAEDKDPTHWISLDRLKEEWKD
jgi:hypothetical protein